MNWKQIYNERRAGGMVPTLDWESLEAEGRESGAIREMQIEFGQHQLLGIFEQVATMGGRVFLVGGAVRDWCWAHDVNVMKDLDFEVYGLSYEDLLDALSLWGKCDLVGKSFGVIKFTDNGKGGSGKTFDFSIPRRDSKTGVGHKDFTVTFDPTLTPHDAAARRDFTVNSIMYDPLTELIWDYYNGEVDLRDGILRHTSAAFAEDPLRVLRGMQLICRLGH